MLQVRKSAAYCIRSEMPTVQEARATTDLRCSSAQVLDARLEADLEDQPGHFLAPEGPDENLEPEVEETTLDDHQNEIPVEEVYPDGSQYEDEDSPDHCDYDVYPVPSEEVEPVYIRAMHEVEHSADTALPQFDDLDSKSRRELTNEPEYESLDFSLRAGSISAPSAPPGEMPRTGEPAARMPTSRALE
jgi:hypothetical protein